jgi:hypothetical protein
VIEPQKQNVENNATILVKRGYKFTEDEINTIIFHPIRSYQHYIQAQNTLIYPRDYHNYIERKV